MTDATREQKVRLRTHFGLSRSPFTKYAWASKMFESAEQRELVCALRMWLEEIRGFASVSGPPGVGKSISLRRFIAELDDQRYRVFDFSYLPSTVTGFLRSLNRLLGLPMRLHATDLFDAAQKHLIGYQQEHGPHPVLLIDDAEGLTVPICDVLRRLTCYELDAEDRFSVLLAGTEDVVATLRHPQLEPLRSRVSYAHTLRPFRLEDTRNYIRYHLERADASGPLFTDEAVQRLFQASQGRPRAINQLAVQCLIAAAAAGRDQIDGDFVKARVQDHPLYHGSKAT